MGHSSHHPPPFLDHPCTHTFLICHLTPSSRCPRLGTLTSLFTNYYWVQVLPPTRCTNHPKHAGFQCHGFLMLDNRCIGLKSSLQTKPPTAIEGGVTGCRRITRVLHQLWTVALLEGSMRLDIDMFWIPRAHSLLCTTSHSHPARPPVGNPCLFRGSDPLHFFHDLYFAFPLHLTSSNGYNAMS